MENLKRFCRNSVRSVPMYFTKFRSKNSKNVEDVNCDEDEKKLFLHSDYLCNVLVGEQVEKFRNAIDNANYLFKSGTLRINLALDAWKVDHSSSKWGNEIETPLSKMGVKLIEITSIMENLLQRDPVLFYTAGDRQLISQLLIPLSNSMGKLKRKISRLCQRVDEHQKTISQLTSRYNECEDDHIFLMEADESDTDSVMDTAVVLKKRTPDMHKRFLRLWLFLTCTKNPADLENHSLVPTIGHQACDQELRIQSRRRLSCKNELMEFQTSEHFLVSNSYNSEVSSDSKPLFEMLCPTMDSTTVNFIKSSLTTPTSHASSSELQDGFMDAWRKQSYEQVLHDTFLQDPPKMETFDDFYTDFEEDARTLSLIQRKIDNALNGDFSEENCDVKYDKNVSINQLKETQSVNENNSNLVDSKYEMGSTCYIGESDAKCNANNALESTEENVNDNSEYCIADAVVTISLKETPKEGCNMDEDHNCLSENTVSQLDKHEECFARFPLDPMTCYEYNVSEMFSYINDQINCLRSLERFWLEPINDQKIKGNAKHNHELAEIVDCLVFTMNALKDPLFNEQIYLEDKEQMIHSLKPVTQSVTSCSKGFADLTRLILKDALYLQKIMDHFPLYDADLVVYDHDIMLECSN